MSCDNPMYIKVIGSPDASMAIHAETIGTLTFIKYVDSRRMVTTRKY